MRIWGPERFSPHARESAEALWSWFSLAEQGSCAQSDLERVRTGVAPSGPLGAAWSRAAAACRIHGIDPIQLGDPLEAALKLQAGEGPRRSADIEPLADMLVGSHARMLATLAGYRTSWQREGAGRLGIGVALIRDLVEQPQRARNRLSLLAQSDLEAAGITRQDLTRNAPPESYSRVAWKQSIRAREAFAASRTLIVEMGLRDRLYTKRCWLGGLEILHAVEQIQFDVWNGFPTLGALTKTRVVIQSIFGQAAFKNA